MQRETAFDLGRSLIGVVTLLDYLLGRGSAWNDPAVFRRCRNATAHVMGNAYFFLRPIWAEHPDLDPAQGDNPLQLPLDSTLPPDPFSSEEAIPVLRRVNVLVPRLVAQLSEDEGYRARVHEIRTDAEELLRSVKIAEDAFRPEPPGT